MNDTQTTTWATTPTFPNHISGPEMTIPWTPNHPLCMSCCPLILRLTLQETTSFMFSYTLLYSPESRPEYSFVYRFDSGLPTPPPFFLLFIRFVPLTISSTTNQGGVNKSLTHWSPFSDSIYKIKGIRHLLPLPPVSPMTTTTFFFYYRQL